MDRARAPRDRGNARWAATSWFPRGLFSVFGLDVARLNDAELRRLLRRRGVHGVSLSERDFAEHFDEALDILLVVVDVRADAQTAEPRRGVHVLRGEALGQVGRHALGEADAED